MVEMYMRRLASFNIWPVYHRVSDLSDIATGCRCFKSSHSNQQSILHRIAVTPRSPEYSSCSIERSSSDVGCSTLSQVTGERCTRRL